MRIREQEQEQKHKQEQELELEEQEQEQEQDPCAYFEITLGSLKGARGRPVTITPRPLKSEKSTPSLTYIVTKY
eukprot:Awhi_evm1s9537